MKIAIMQPYYYPYIGYFELINAVDTFVFLDDVQYVKRRWINRNRIRSNCGWQYITVPVVHSPQKTQICDIEISGLDWHIRQMKTLAHTYGKIENPILDNFKDQWSKTNLNDLLQETIIFVSKFLNLKTKFINSKHLRASGTAQNKLIEICKVVGASTYVNAVGGKSLYDETDFNNEGIKLEFMNETKATNTLSILDLILGDGYSSIA